MIALNLQRKIQNTHILHITLTLQSSDRPLVDQIKHLLNAFKDLRRRPTWITRPGHRRKFDWSKRRRRHTLKNGKSVTAYQWWKLREPLPLLLAT